MLAAALLGFIVGYCLREFRERRIIKDTRRMPYTSEEYVSTTFKGGHATFIEPVSARERFEKAKTVDDLLTK